MPAGAFCIPRNKRAQRISRGIHLQVGRKARGDLSRIREDKDFAAAKRSKVARFYRIRWLNLELLCDERLKRLIALCLMILHRAAAESRNFSAAPARNELASCFESLVHVAVLVRRGNNAVLAEADRAHSCPVDVRIQTARL